MSKPRTAGGPTARSPSRVWIAHHDPAQRLAIARIAAASSDAVLGAPGDPIFDVADAPGVIVLGLSGELERELDFAARVRARFGERDEIGERPWILLDERGEPERIAALFDTLELEILPAPPTHAAIRAAIERATGRPRVDSLSRRAEKLRIQGRFLRWFADLDLPELMRAIDPALVDAPLLVASETGCGAETAARYVHSFAEDLVRPSRFVAIDCERELDEAGISSQLRAADRGDAALCVWLGEVDALAPALQRRLANWISVGPPAGLTRAGVRRWMAGTSDPRSASLHVLEPQLAAALAGLRLRIPPLRERLDSVPAIAQDIADAWCDARDVPHRALEPAAIDALRHYPWPGNSQELEAVVHRTLTSTAGPEIRAEQLCFDVLAPALDGEEALVGGAGPQAAPSEASAASPFLDVPTFPLGEPDGAPEGLDEDGDVEYDDDFDEPDPFAELATPPGFDGAGHVEREEAPDTLADAEMELALSGLGEIGVVADEAKRGVTAPHASTMESDGDHSWRRLASAIAHEVRNPLVSIRTFAELLPEYHHDEEFRGRFQELVSADVRRIEEIVDRLQRLALTDAIEREPVDVTTLLETLLEEHAEDFAASDALVQPELDSEHPIALAEPLQLHEALSGVFVRAARDSLRGGTIFVASKHHPTGLRGEPSVRILVRYATRLGGQDADPEGRGQIARAGLFDPDATAARESALDRNALEFAVAEATVRAHAGLFTVDTSSGRDVVVLIDLPAAL